MSLLSRLTDRLVLCPTTHAIDAGDLVRESVPFGHQQLEVWTTQIAAVSRSSEGKAIAMVKFPGTGGRAERSTASPCHIWEDVSSDIWTVNPLGYGGSTGTASLQSFPAMVDAVYASLRAIFPDHKLVAYGNSLGTISALALAARHHVDGLYLRNCVPIHQLIATRPRYAWPSLGLSRFVAAQIPDRLDAIANAKQIKSPCLFVTSGNDRVVPPRFQAKIMEAFAGQQRVFTIPAAEHGGSIPEELAEPYIEDLEWLKSSIFES